MYAMPRKIYDLDDDLCRRIADYRFENRIDSEAKAVRELLEFALAEKAKPTGKKGS